MRDFTGMGIHSTRLEQISALFFDEPIKHVRRIHQEYLFKRFSWDEAERLSRYLQERSLTDQFPAFTRGITFIASAIIEATSETLAGRMTVLVAFASSPNLAM